MKNLLYQNGIQIIKKPNVELFYCNCGSIFESDEYKVNNEEKEDICPVCKRVCIIKEKLDTCNKLQKIYRSIKDES